MKRSSLEKALAVMEYLGERGGAPLTDVSRDLDLSRATAFRTLVTLERHGYVTHLREQHSFSLGPTIGELARGLETVSLVELASPALADLSERTLETVNLAVLRRGRLVYASIYEGPHPLRMSGQVGAVVPLHATALGKAVLAGMPGSRRERLLGPEPFEAYTPKTITRMRELDRELTEIAEQGYAVDDEEVDAGAVCVAAAVLGPRDEPIGALSISAVTARHTAAEMAAQGPLLYRWAQDIGRALRDRETAASVARGG